MGTEFLQFQTFLACHEHISNDCILEVECLKMREKNRENETKQIRIEIKVDGIEGWLEMVQKLVRIRREGGSILQR